MVLPLNIPQISIFSDEELIRLCIANPELHIERDENGQLLINMSPTYALTSSNNSELNFEIALWNRQHKAGKVFDSNAAFILPDSSMRGPDIAWIAQHRWDSLSIKEKKSFPKIVPDFVAELQSDTDNIEELKIKMTKWVQNGVCLAWLISPREKQTYIYYARTIEIVPFDQVLSGKDILADFEIILSNILEL